ncbi:MAG: alkaline phosphatase family protein [bacterium]
MSLPFSRLFRKQRVFVLSLDGVPYSFLKEQMANGTLPYMERLFMEGSFNRMNSVIPPVSSVAWSSYMTGRNPAGHNIYGFVDRKTNPLKLFIPTGSHMRTKTLWERLSDECRKVIVINIPVTSPPRPVNGVLISGFLAPSLDKAVYPQSLIPRLKEWGYQIDIDAQRARNDRKFFVEDLNRSTSRRLDISVRLMDEYPWDFFHLHIMGTDRINHFLWGRWEDGDPCFAAAFVDYYRSLDRFIGQILIPFIESQRNTSLVILSDHGFCRLKKEVFINHWLIEHGWLKLKSEDAKSIEDIHPDTRAYSLIPGRIYLNLKGREPEGRIDPHKGYKETLELLREALSLIEDPETGERIIDKIFMRDEIYSGPFINQAPDMVVLPNNGYDLKGDVNQQSLTRESNLEGMHTFDDAFLFIKGQEIKREGFSILDVTPTILALMGFKPYPDLDGRCLI